jgi:hypothetical protein
VIDRAKQIAMRKMEYCAILLWTLMSMTILIPKISGANIKIKPLSGVAHDDSEENKHLVNITRNYDGDIIFIKGKISSSSFIFRPKSFFFVIIMMHESMNLLNL